MKDQMWGHTVILVPLPCRALACTSSHLNFTENLMQAGSCFFPPWQMRERALRPVQAIFHSPLGETVERRNAMLKASSRTANMPEQKSWIIIFSTHVILFLRPCFPSALPYVSKTVVFACKLYVEQLECYIWPLTISRDWKEKNKTGSVLWLSRKKFHSRKMWWEPNGRTQREMLLLLLALPCFFYLFKCTRGSVCRIPSNVSMVNKARDRQMALTFLPTDPSWDLRIFFIMFPAASFNRWEMKRSWKVYVVSEPPSKDHWKGLIVNIRYDLEDYLLLIPAGHRRLASSRLNIAQ